jgi:phosphatidylglycerol:prolipoprotein diacylglycerol transferase
MAPKLVTLGPVTLHTYGLLVALGLLLGIYVAGRFASRGGLERETITNLGIYVALVALLGAKLGLLASAEIDWRHPGQIFSLAWLQAGGVFYGGLAAAAVFSFWYAHRKRLDFANLADVFAPGIAAGHALGRLGCLSAGCCWGKPTELAWAVTFTNPYSNQIVGVPLHIGLHPTQLYEALAEGVIFVLLLALWRRRRYPGEIFAAYLMLYAMARFAIEFYRGDPRGPEFFGNALSTPQVLSLCLFAVAALLFWWQRRRAVRGTLHGS